MKWVSIGSPVRRLNQCWFIVNYNLKSKRQWNWNRDIKPFIHENAFENVLREMVAILSAGDEYQIECVVGCCTGPGTIVWPPQFQWLQPVGIQQQQNTREHHRVHNARNGIFQLSIKILSLHEKKKYVGTDCNGLRWFPTISQLWAFLCYIAGLYNWNEAHHSLVKKSSFFIYSTHEYISALISNFCFITITRLHDVLLPMNYSWRLQQEAEPISS